MKKVSDAIASELLEREPNNSESVVLTESAKNHWFANSGIHWLLWENRKTIWKAVLYGTLIAALVSVFIPNKYQSTTKVVPPDQQSTSMMMMALASKIPALGAAGDLLGAKSSNGVYIPILKSRTVLDHLINKFQLQKIYRDRYMKEAREDLSSNTAIDEDKKTGLISITTTDKDRERARGLAQAYVDELNRVSADLNTTSAHRERVFVEGRIRQVTQELDQASRRFSEFSSKNTAIDLKEQGRAMVEAAATLQGQLIASESELKGLQQIYTGNNVRIRSLEGRISELKRQLDKLGGSDASLAQKTNDGLYPSIRKLPLLGVEYADLYRQVRVQETVFELLTQQFEMAKIQEAREIPTVRVLDPPDFPEKKSSPQRVLICLAAGFFSLALVCGWIIFRSYWSHVDSQSEMKMFAKVTKDELLGTIPAKYRRQL